MENTRVALRESLRQVLDQRDQTNVWLNGLAGVGKTSIAFTVAEEMKAAERLAATFFFSHKHAQSGAAIIPTIAYQLALVYPRIRQDILKAIVDDQMLLSAGKSRNDQIQKLVIMPLSVLRFRQETPYAIIIDALDECLSAEEATRLVTLLTKALSGPDLPIIHLIFTSRPELNIRIIAMEAGLHEIPLTTNDTDTIQDVRFFLRASLDKIRTSRPTVFGQPPKPWPSDGEFRTLAFKAGGLFVYAAMAMNFLSATGYHPQQRLDLLVREKSTVSADIDQLYRQIIATTENPSLYCQMLAFIIHLYYPLRLAKLQELFHANNEDLAVMLEVFSPVILNPPDGIGTIEIYHASLRDFMMDPLRSKQYYVDSAHAHEHLASCCFDLLIRRRCWSRPSFDDTASYAFDQWSNHLRVAYPSSRLRNLLHTIFAEHQFLFPTHALDDALCTCLSKWFRTWSDIALSWHIAEASMTRTTT
ncbi:uncharacterized protein EDB91DRAFT_1249867 [Suillus paluster]|uniref:uncharacterized protein n=1 Tax=Suillus paluster TaxID=48578 RepID=UPI001B86BDBF|nr:uncharacterized protein EDB91DRAFT_1249867 [Suillus paluster]KAG1736900.1 hypothetical protein EDB91DRAFT_1249867 [Suillus paluster]